MISPQLRKGSFLGEWIGQPRGGEEVLSPRVRVQWGLSHEAPESRMKRDQFLGVDSMKGREEEVRGHLTSGEKSGGGGQPPMWRGGDQPGHVQGQDQKRRQVVCSSGRWNG